MNRSYFLSAHDLRNSITPPRQVVEKVGKTQRVVKRGNLNVLRFDNVRFLLPKERAEVRHYNESMELERELRDFDVSPIADRDYQKLEKSIRDKVTHKSTLYFNLRRAARNRLMAIKEVRREAKQSDQIPDADFNSNDFLDSVLKQAESIIIDLGRRRAIMDRLNLSLSKSLEDATASLEDSSNDC
jgi:carbamoylphosphate synthase small subunit